MATMSTDNETDGEYSRPENMAGYNTNVDAIREIEYPMLQGRRSTLIISQKRELIGIRNDLSRPRRDDTLPQVSHR